MMVKGKGSIVVERSGKHCGKIGEHDVRKGNMVVDRRETQNYCKQVKTTFPGNLRGRYCRLL